jgi:hypothetical protein
MPSFEEALKTTLHLVHDGFERADTDLHHEVAAAARDLGKLTQGAATMMLRKTLEGEKGVRYELVLSGNGVEASVGTFFVPARGYPILCESANLSSSEGLTCNDKQALAEYFIRLASNPDSGLVTQTAYIMRKQ